MKQSRTIRSLEKFFWLFLFINPFLDILNGVYMKVIAGLNVLDVNTALSSVTPTLVVRMVVLLIFALYILMLKDTKAILTIIPIGIAWALSVLSEYINFGTISLFTDMQYIARFVYNVVLLMVFTHVFYHRWGDDKAAFLEELDRLISFTLIVLSLSILISYLFNVGYSTYADRLGYRGSRGFFYAGNDVTAVLILLLPLSMSHAMRAKLSMGLSRFLTKTLPFALTFNTLLIIGSKTAFIGAACTTAAMFLFAVIAFFTGKEKSYLPTSVIVIISSCIIFGILLLFSSSLVDNISKSFSATGELIENESVSTAVFSGRQVKLMDQLHQMKQCGILAYLFGMGRGSQAMIVEMDIFEIFLYYGLFGACAMLWIYCTLGFQFVVNFFKKFDLTAFALMLSLVMTTGYLVMAGHVLFSVTAGFYYSFTIIYSRVYFAKEKQELFWKGTSSHAQ